MGAVDCIGGRLKGDVHTAALAKGVVVKNIDDFNAMLAKYRCFEVHQKAC